MDNHISIAIHTPQVAENLKNALSKEGVDVSLSPFKLPNAECDDAFVSLNVADTDLKKALKIIENEADKQLAVVHAKLAGMSGTLLIPVDFSPYSETAVKVAFDLAGRLSLKPFILHSLSVLYIKDAVSFPETSSVDISDAQMAVELRREAEVKMRRLVEDIKARISSGEYPNVDFDTEITEGVPEEVILEYARQKKPDIIVMATRGVSRRAKELIGSVTAEVLDSCRSPLFIVPENFGMPKIRDVNKVLFFCYLDKQDIMSMDSFQSMFDYPVTDLFIVPINGVSSDSMASKLDSLSAYFKRAYPGTNSSIHVFDKESFDEDLERLISEKGVQLIVIPNKKRNIFARFFNPSMAHRLFFEKDLPMLAFPV